MDYFTDNTKLVVVTEDGRELEKECESTKPDKENFDAIRKAEKEGKASFKDVATYRGNEAFNAVRAKLFYDGEKVGDRKFPVIKIQEADTLEVTFELQLIRENGVVRIKT